MALADCLGEMKMLARLRYLISEGFEVSSISGYDDASGEGNARIMYLRKTETGPKVCSEIFEVDSDEMQQCSDLFIAHLLETEE